MYRWRIRWSRLRQPAIDRARSVSPLLKIPLSRWRRTSVTLLTFFEWQRDYLADVWPRHERPDVQDKLEPEGE